MSEELKEWLRSRTGHGEYSEYYELALSNLVALEADLDTERAKVKELERDNETVTKTMKGYADELGSASLKIRELETQNSVLMDKIKTLENKRKCAK